MDNNIKLDISKDREDLLKFFNGKGYVTQDIKFQFKADYEKDYWRKVYLPKIKLLAYIFITLFIILSIIFNIFNSYLVFLNLLMVIICLIGFRNIGKLSPPNNKFNIWYLISITLILVCFSIIFYFQKNNFIVNYKNIIKLFETNIIDQNSYNLITKFSNIYFILCLAITILFSIIFNIVGKRNISSALAVLICSGGQSIFYFLVNYALSSKIILDDNAINFLSFILLLNVSFLAMLLYDCVLLFLFLNSKKNKKIKNKNEQLRYVVDDFDF